MILGICLELLGHFSRSHYSRIPTLVGARERQDLFGDPDLGFGNEGVGFGFGGNGGLRDGAFLGLCGFYSTAQKDIDPSGLFQSMGALLQKRFSRGAFTSSW